MSTATQQPLRRGMQITIIGYRGVRKRVRVWEDADPGVLICSETEYRRALREGDEALAAGFPKQDIVEVDPASAQGAE